MVDVPKGMADAIQAASTKKMSNIEVVVLAMAIATAKTNMVRFAMLTPQMGAKEAATILADAGYLPEQPEL